MPAQEAIRRQETRMKEHQDACTGEAIRRLKEHQDACHHRGGHQETGNKRPETRMKEHQDACLGEGRPSGNMRPG